MTLSLLGRQHFSFAKLKPALQLPSSDAEALNHQRLRLHDAAVAPPRGLTLGGAFYYLRGEPHRPCRGTPLGNSDYEL